MEIAIRLPLFSCPFRGCVYATDDRSSFLDHLVSNYHYALVSKLCSRFFAIAPPLDFVHNAISIIERGQIPCIGMATTRRALRRLTQVYNDKEVKALVCFLCGEIHTTIHGPEPLKEELSIEYINRDWFRSVEARHPGSLLNNCSYELWEKRYMSGYYAQEGDEQQRQVLHRACPGPPGRQPHARDLSEWCLCVQLVRGSASLGSPRMCTVARRLPFLHIRRNIEAAPSVAHYVMIVRCQYAEDVELVLRLTVQPAKATRFQWLWPTTTIMGTR